LETPTRPHAPILTANESAPSPPLREASPAVKVTADTVSLSKREARRIALRAQGFRDAWPAGAVDRRHLRRVLGRIALVQIDSVNVLVRSHYLPLFSRAGPYRRALIDEAAYARRRELFEYWGHEASLLPLGLFGLMRWRMARAERLDGVYGGLARFVREKRSFVEAVYREVERRGPLGAGELEKRNRAGSWWGWTETKAALEYLFWVGRVTTAFRRSFERVYDLTERVIPADVRAAPAPAEAEAQRALLAIAMRALGVATEGDLRDYFRLPAADAKVRIAEMLEARELTRARVEGWKPQAFVAPGTTAARSAPRAALLSPFDSLVWQRDRTHRLFDFHYRLEIYTPAHKRVHGYYVLPFLLGDELVARVDLKADRAAGVLQVRGLHVEAHAARDAVIAALEPELERMGAWLELEAVAGLRPRPRGRPSPARNNARAAG
jgi:uncharacterized protein